MAMTYQDLLENIQTMTPEQRKMDVTVYVSGVDEFYPLVHDYPYVIADNAKTDVLDPGHPYLVI